MLGKVFENLIPENERKGSGTFYTPREIVHYMCQESLINYLDTKLNIEQHQVEDKTAQPSLLPNMDERDLLTKYEDVYVEHVPRDDIAEFIYHGDVAQEHDATTRAKDKETSAYSFKIPETIRNNARAIDEALAYVKICDPAIGSGAFPVGIMNEIVRARQMLNAYLDDEGRTPYDFKRNAIQESIYGVDIEPSAVDIAKLRLWLSLVVDEDDFSNIKPLPNLDYKIMTGDSLIKEMSQKDMAYKGWLDELISLQKSIFGEYSPSRKQGIKDRIDRLLENLFQGHDSDFRFNYWIQFHDVMSRGGFDIVIANPPYVSIEKFSGTRRQKDWKNTFDVFAARGDIYCLFIELGVSLLRKYGDLCFITSNKYFRSGYGRKIREYLTKEVSPTKIIDFGELPIFDATAYPAIIQLSKSPVSVNSTSLIAIIDCEEQLRDVTVSVKDNSSRINLSDLSIDGWVLEKAHHLDLISKLKYSGTQLAAYLEQRKIKIFSGIKTGFNEAYIIDESKKNELIDSDVSSKDLIKSWIRGKDIKRWQISWKNTYAIIIPKNFHDKMNEYPAILEHLNKHENKLRKRGQCEGTEEKPGTRQHHWLELDNNPTASYLGLYEKPKLIVPDLSPEPRFYLGNSDYYLDMTAFMIPIEDNFLVGVLNSNVLSYFLERYHLLFAVLLYATKKFI